MSKKEIRLFKACLANDVRGVENALKKSLFSKVPDVNSKPYDSVNNADWNTLLHFAAKNGNAEIVKLLITAGARVDVYNIRKENPLQHAAENGNVEVGRILINAGADVKEHKDNSREPIEIALDNEKTDFATLLAENGVDIKPRTRALLNLLVKYNKSKSVQWLIETGYNINEEDYSHKTLLFEVVENRNVEAARMLIGIGANVNVADNSKKSPLSYAVEKGDAEMTRLLLENGADMNNAAPIAVSNNNTEIIDLLLARDNKNATSLLTHARGDIETIKILVKHGADINLATMSGSFEPRSMLKLAIDTKNIELAKALIEMGGQLTYEVGGKKKYMFTEAIKLGNTGLVDLMLAHGAEINENGSAPLTEAIQLNNKEMIDFLIKKGAVPNDKTRAIVDQLEANEKLLEEIKNIPAGDLYNTMLSNNEKKYKEVALDRYINSFPEQFDFEKCKSGKNIINAIINIKKPAEDDKEVGSPLSDLIKRYGKLMEKAYLIMAKSGEYRVVVGHTSLSGDYETTVTRSGFDSFKSEEIMTDWN